MSTPLLRTNWQGSPRQRRTLRRRGLPKLALNSGTTRRSAKNADKNANHHPAESRVPLSVPNWNVHHSGDELNLWHFHCRNETSLRDHRDVDNLDELHNTAPVVAHNGHLLHVCTGELLDLHNQHRPPCQCTAAGELWFGEQDHGNLPLHDDRDVDDLVKKINELQLRKLHSFLLFETQMHLSSQQRACHHRVQELQLGTPRAALSGPKPLSCTTTGKTTLSMNWTSPHRRPAQQGHRPPCRRGTARDAAKTQPARRPAATAATTPPPPHRPTQRAHRPPSPPAIKKFSAGAEVEPVGGLVDTATVVYDSALDGCND